MIQKTIQDYYERMFELYPTIPKSDIKRILQYGWKSFYLHNSYGGDVLISRQGFWTYCGNLMNNSIKWFEYYKNKMRVKLRVIYKRKRIQWNGYYYFALSRLQYEEYLNQKKRRGRPKKWFTFSNTILYKIYDECNIIESGKVAIFKIPMFLDLGFTTYKEKLTTDKAELVLTREPLKLEDILLSNYDYEFITDKKYKRKMETDG